MNHHRRDAFYAPDLRGWQRMQWHDTALDTLAHTADVRHIDRGAVRQNIRNVGLFLFRVRAFPLTRTPAPADPLDPAGRLRRFNPLGIDTALHTLPQTEAEISHLAEAINLPLPIQRRWMAAHLSQYYGTGKSILLEQAGAHPGDPPVPIPATSLRVCNLSDLTDAGGNVIDWAHVPTPGSGLFAIDPVLGRIACANAPATDLLVTFHYGFTAAIGGGEYERGELSSELQPVRSVGGGNPLQPDLDAVRNGGAVEIVDSGSYPGPAAIHVDAGKSITLRAANGSRPLISLGATLSLDLEGEATVILDGLVIAGAALRLPPSADELPRKIVLRHCTLLPGPKSAVVGLPSADDPSLVVEHPFASVEIERCIVGPLHVVEGARVTVRDSIVDATSTDLVAYRSPSGALAAGATLTIENTTVIGKVHAQELALASNTLFVSELAAGDAWKAPLWAERRQSGCVRFCYVPPGSRTPHRFQCQPPEGGDPRLRPHFTSLRYGDSGYCQLHASTPEAIRRGADDESEIGVLHHIHQPQRETNLRVRLEEYLRFGLEAGILFSN
jgi:hypothetical protein